MTTPPRSSAFILSLALIVSIASSALAPKITHAQAPIPVFETNVATLAAFGEIAVSTGITATAETQDRAKEDIFDAIAWAVAKTVVQSMTRSIVNWINSGYQGEPAFSQDLTRDLRQVGDGITGLFLSNISKQLQEGKILSPFAADMAQLTVSAYYLATSDDDLLAQRLKYTLLGYTQNSVNYMRGNLPPRGLQDWHSMIFQCGNDPVCASFTTQAHLVNQIDAEAQKFLADFNNGRGFLSWKGECTDTAASAEGNAAYQQCVAENEASDGPPQDCFVYYELAGANLSDADTCVAHDTLTPGSVVESALVEQFGSPLRQLELADSVNEIVGAAVTQLVGQVLGGSGLARASSPSAGGRGTPVNNATNPGTTGATLGAGFAQTVRTERENTDRFRTAWIDIRTIAIGARDACPAPAGAIGLNRANEIQEAIRRADTAITRAETAISALDRVLALLQGIDGSEISAAERASSSQRAYEIYQGLLSGNELVSGQEQIDATTQRSEATGSNSLYLRMTAFENQCT